MKCCKHCQEYDDCEEVGECCEKCQFYDNGACTYEKDPWKEGKEADEFFEDEDDSLPTTGDFKGPDF